MLEEETMPINSLCVTNQVAENTVPWTLPETLRDLASEGDPCFVADLIVAFKVDTTNHLRDTRNAVRSGDRTCLSAQAHSIKGSSGQMGAIALAAIWEQVEFAALETPASQLISYIDDAEKEFTNVCRAMATYSLEYGSNQRPC
jgi:HPt (histidine-containing phosphotransfer) domain-containing protein